MFLLRRIPDGKFVAVPGNVVSYTAVLQRAEIFTTREAAEAARCPENEYVVSLETILKGNITR
jgi:hypothetical protein